MDSKCSLVFILTILDNISTITSIAMITSFHQFPKERNGNVSVKKI